MTVFLGRVGYVNARPCGWGGVVVVVWGDVSVGGCWGDVDLCGRGLVP